MSATPRTDALRIAMDSFGNIPTMEDRYQRMGRHARDLEGQNAELLAALKAMLTVGQPEGLRDMALAAIEKAAK